MVVLVEVAALDDTDAHRAQELPRDGEDGHGLYLVIVVAAAPTHEAVAHAEEELRVGHLLHARQPEQLALRGIFLRPKLFVQPHVEHLVLVEAVVGGEEVVALQVEDGDINDHDAGDEELQGNECGA